jgi:hypothetical protein
VVAIRPDRLAVYGYAHLPELFRPQRQIDAADLPSAETQARAAAAGDREADRGRLRYIGMDHFALPDDELARAQQRGGLHRNFMGYTTHADSDLVGLGVSAISHIGDSFSQNPRDLPTWEAALDDGRLPVMRRHALDEDDQLRADLIQSLMCQGEIPVAALERRYGIDFGNTSRTHCSGCSRWWTTGWSCSGPAPSARRRVAACCCVTSRCASTATSPCLPTPRAASRVRSEAPCPPSGARGMSGPAFPRPNPRTLADDGDALHFCSTCAFSQACLDEGMDKGALMDLHVLVEHVGPLQPGAHVFREGDPFDAIAAVRAGTVKTYVVDPDGREHVLGFHLPGEVIGLNAIDGDSYPCNAVALDTVMLCRFSFPRIAVLATRVPGLQRHLFRLLSRDIGRANLLAGTGPPTSGWPRSWWDCRGGWPRAVSRRTASP